jgi:signal transduction histidine kinase
MGISRALWFRFAAVRLVVIALPLICCVSFSLILSGLLVDRYAESHEVLEGEEISPLKLFQTQIPLVARSGLALALVFAALVPGAYSFLKRASPALIRRPLGDLSQGLEALRRNRRGFRLELPPGASSWGRGLFRPLYRRFNEAALALEEGLEGDAQGPLTEIRDFLDGLGKLLGTLPGWQRQFLRGEEEGLAGLALGMNELLLLLSLDRGEFPLSRSSLELGRFLESFLQDRGEEYRDQGLDLRLIFNREGLRIRSDEIWLRDALGRILDHFVRNRRLERGRVALHYRRRDASPGLVEIVLGGNNPALSEKALLALFDRPGFFQDRGGSGDRENSGEGSGLSLALAARIIRNLGGSIYAEKSPAGGPLTVICFPLAPAAP